MTQDKTQLLPFAPTHRHKKRGTEYEVMGEGQLQTETPLEDYASVLIYRGEDGKLWVRPVDEFNDGRFEQLPSTHAAYKASADKQVQS